MNVIPIIESKLTPQEAKILEFHHRASEARINAGTVACGVAVALAFGIEPPNALAVLAFLGGLSLLHYRSCKKLLQEWKRSRGYISWI